MQRTFSVAMSGERESSLLDHLARADGQEDLCFAIWRPSTGVSRLTALVNEPIWPLKGEHHVHGNASFESEYTLRAAQEALSLGGGIVLLHSHPSASGWQPASGPDAAAEASIANIAQEITHLPLVGMTVGTGDGSWSARLWSGAGRSVSHEEAESVRIVADTLRVTFNEELRPSPTQSEAQARTVSAWGKDVQALISRLRILVVGLGSVGSIVAERLGRTGVQTIGLMDHESIEVVNLDRLLGATRLDAALKRSKAEVADRVVRQAETAVSADVLPMEWSVCEPPGLASLLDYDLVISCVDRPWPRHVLNTVAYADLLPVLDGGIRVESFPNGGLRNAYWRTHVARAGQPCLACLRQYDPALVQVERDGSLDSPTYVDNLPDDSPLKTRQNVAIFSSAAASALLTHFLSLVVAPSGLSDPGPLEYALASHSIGRNPTTCVEGCPYSGDEGVGDGRIDPTGAHHAAESARAERGRLAPHKKLRRLIARFVEGRNG